MSTSIYSFANVNFYTMNTDKNVKSNHQQPTTQSKKHQLEITYMYDPKPSK